MNALVRKFLNSKGFEFLSNFNDVTLECTDKCMDTKL